MEFASKMAVQAGFTAQRLHAKALAVQATRRQREEVRAAVRLFIDAVGPTFATFPVDENGTPHWSAALARSNGTLDRLLPVLTQATNRIVATHRAIMLDGRRRAYLAAAELVRQSMAGTPLREAWDPEAHPRAPAGTEQGGEFAPKGGGTYTPSVAIVSSAATGGRQVFRGQARPIRATISKQESGQLGEHVVIAWLQSQGFADARPVTQERNNFAFDVIRDHEIIEVKTGLVSNGPSAQQWRLTIGEPGVKEQSWLRNVSDRVKARWHAEKQRRIGERKARALRAVERQLGRRLRARTITVILDPDRRQADVYSFRGWHDRIGWNSDTARKGYVTTVRYR